MADWTQTVSAPDWGDRVVEALVRYFRDGRRLSAPATLVEATTEFDTDGVPVLRAVYDHGWSQKRLGLRRRLDGEPMTDNEPTPEESLAEEIALYEISEPIGRLYDLLVEEADGVWWWGDGYPDLSEHPDFNLRSGEVRNVPCLLRGSFDPWPGELTEGALVLSAEGAVWRAARSTEDQPLFTDVTFEEVTTRVTDHREPGVPKGSSGMELGAVLVPSPLVVTCRTSSGSIDIVVSPANVAIVEGFFWKMTG
jgi:hypothetical protein